MNDILIRVEHDYQVIQLRQGNQRVDEIVISFNQWEAMKNFIDVMLVSPDNSNNELKV